VEALLATYDDNELLRMMIAGDEAAFTQLYNRRQGPVYRFALHMSGSQAIAEDVTQEVFMVLISEAARYNASRGSLSAYLYGIARNHVLRRMRRDRMLVQLDGESEDTDRRTQAGKLLCSVICMRWDTPRRPTRSIVQLGLCARVFIELAPCLSKNCDPMTERALLQRKRIQRGASHELPGLSGDLGRNRARSER
jgi:RNA polymerase sigma factor (sigma-70 family)